MDIRVKGNTQRLPTLLLLRESIMSKVNQYDKVKKFFNQQHKKGLRGAELRAVFDDYMAKLTEKELEQLKAEYEQVQKAKAIDKSVSFEAAS